MGSTVPVKLQNLQPFTHNYCKSISFVVIFCDCNSYTLHKKNDNRRAKWCEKTNVKLVHTERTRKRKRKRSKNNRKRSKKKFQTSKKIFAFVFTRCKRTLGFFFHISKFRLIFIAHIPTDIILY